MCAVERVPKKETQYDPNTPPPLNRLGIGKEDAGRVDSTLCAMMGIDAKELAKLRRRIAENGYQLRVFVHHQYRYGLLGEGEFHSPVVKVGVEGHINQAQKRKDTVPVLLFLEESPFVDVVAQCGSSGVYCVRTQPGSASLSDKNIELANLFDKTLTHTGTHAQYSEFLYKLLLDALGVKRIILGGIYRDMCMMGVRDAAFTLGIETAFSRFEEDSYGRNVRGKKLTT